MKKILSVLALVISGSVFAGTVTLEGQSIDNGSAADQRNANMTVRENITKSVAGHVQVSTTQTDGTNAVSTRLETGLTATTALFGPVSGYSTVALGTALKSSGNYGYYSVEPGLSAPIGSTGLTAKVGYRLRSAFNDSIADTTRTARVGVSYALTKVDTVGVRYDHVTGDATQKAVALNYTRSF